MALQIVLPIAAMVVARLAGLLRVWRARMRSRRERRAFAGLNNHLLRDIGLDRGAVCWRRHAAAGLGKSRQDGGIDRTGAALPDRNLVELKR